jgi:hypothetical protein
MDTRSRRFTVRARLDDQTGSGPVPLLRVGVPGAGSYTIYTKPRALSCGFSHSRG